MAKSAVVVAQDIVDLLRRKGVDSATFPWGAFYELTGRERMKDEFKNQLQEAMKRKSFLIVYGEMVVMIAKDFDFAPLSLGRTAR